MARRVPDVAQCVLRERTTIALWITLIANPTFAVFDAITYEFSLLRVLLVIRVVIELALPGCLAFRMLRWRRHCYMSGCSTMSGTFARNFNDMTIVTVEPPFAQRAGAQTYACDTLPANRPWARRIYGGMPPAFAMCSVCPPIST